MKTYAAWIMMAALGLCCLASGCGRTVYTSTTTTTTGGTGCAACDK